MDANRNCDEIALKNRPVSEDLIPQAGKDEASENIPGRNYLSSYVFLAVLAGAVTGLDQYTKWTVRNYIPLGQSWMPVEWLEPVLRIVHWKNSGMAFGMLQGFGGVFTILAIVVAIAIVYYFPQVPAGDWTLRVALGLQLGGALGNLTDRLVIGSVTDFVQVGNFPVFNIADASIFVGVAILLVGVWVTERGDSEATLEVEPPEADPQSPLKETAALEAASGEARSSNEHPHPEGDGAGE